MNKRTVSNLGYMAMGRIGGGINYADGYTENTWGKDTDSIGTADYGTYVANTCDSLTTTNTTPLRSGRAERSLPIAGTTIRGIVSALPGPFFY